MTKKKTLTTAAGIPVPDNQTSLTAGERGPVLLQDHYLVEKLAHFNRERIPERVVHAKAAGAFGTFTVTHDITRYTKAKIFSEVGKQTEMVGRFSTVAGEKGSADTVRDVRGFALKFYTEDGNWDMVGNNTPVFFFRDPLKFIDLNHAVKRDPRTNLRSPNTNWDFWSSLPEALHQVTILMSDRGIPSSYRHMHGSSSHAYSFINGDGVRVWVKFHFRSHQGILNLTDQEAGQVVGMDRESHQRDLYEAIEQGQYPKWTMYVQIMTEEQAKNHYENPFDITKIWRHAEYPLIEVGVLELNRNPENFFAEVEQAAFTPAHVVPGIGFSPDRFLQGRLFSYGDAARYRLGVNHNQIPVNRAKVEVNEYHRDGAMRVDGNYGSTPAYTPNSYGVWSAQPEVMEPPLDLEGAMYRYDPKDDPTDDCFRAGGNLWRILTEEKKQILIENTAADIAPVTENIKYRHAVHCFLADPEYGERFTNAAGLDFAKVQELAKLDNNVLNKATLSSSM